MNPSGKQHSTLLIPTRISKSHQQATHDCGPHDEAKCRNVYVFGEHGAPEERYIADIERYTLLIDHAFMMPFEDQGAGAPVRRGTSVEFPGSFEVCEDPKRHTNCKDVPIPCISGACHLEEGRRLGGEPDADFEERRLGGDKKFFSIKVGDVIQMGELLRLSGIDLNNDTNLAGEPRRGEGFIIQIDVDYSNTRMFHFPPWETTPIRYTYRAGLLPTETYKEVTEEVGGDGNSRVLSDMHGVFVRVQLTGSICYFSFSQFILVMTTSLGLLALAQWAVGFYASNIWRHGGDYMSFKFDRSTDFNKVEGMNFGDHAQAEVKHWNKYAADPPQFTKDFKSLDGETLEIVSDFLLGVYKSLDDGMKDKVVESMAQSVSSRDAEMMTKSPGYMNLPQAAYT